MGRKLFEIPGDGNPLPSAVLQRVIDGQKWSSEGSLKIDGVQEDDIGLWRIGKSRTLDKDVGVTSIGCIVEW